MSNEMGEPGKKRKRVLEEILETERTHYNDLKVLVQVYVYPLRKRAGYPTPVINTIFNHKIPTVPIEQVPEIEINDINTLFCNVESILNVSEQVLKEFDSIGSDLELLGQVGKIFLNLAPFLKVYLAFATTFRSAIDKHEELLQQNTVYKAFCESCKDRAECERGDLQSYLILGVQRVPRYRLLLKALLEHTKDDDSDKPHLLQAYEQISKVTEVINNGVEDFERREKVIRVQRKFIGSGELVKPHRVFVREGDLIKYCKRRPKKFRFVLFNDVIIYGEPTKKTYENEVYKFHRLIELRATRVSALKNELEFLISSPTKSFRVKASSKLERDSWVQSTEEAVKACQSSLVPQSEESHTSKLGSIRSRGSKVIRFSSSSDTTLQTSSSQDEDSHCSLCSTDFGMLRRKHKCYRCEAAVCDKCSPNKWMLPHISQTKSQRVCQPCYNSLFLGVYNVLPEQEDRRHKHIRKTTKLFKHSSDASSIDSPYSETSWGSSFDSISSSDAVESHEDLPLPNDWEKVYHVDGEVYYWNVVTNEVSWDRPTTEEYTALLPDKEEQKTAPIEQNEAQSPPPLPPKPTYNRLRRSKSDADAKKQSIMFGGGSDKQTLNTSEKQLASRSHSSPLAIPNRQQQKDQVLLELSSNAPCFRKAQRSNSIPVKMSKTIGKQEKENKHDATWNQREKKIEVKSIADEIKQFSNLSTSKSMKPRICTASPNDLVNNETKNEKSHIKFVKKLSRASENNVFVEMNHVEVKAEKPKSKTKSEGNNEVQSRKAKTKVFTYDELCNRPYPNDVDPSIREQYLDDNTFLKLFGMDKSAFAAIPQWKQELMKRKNKLW